MVSTYIEIEYLTKSGETFNSTQKVLQFGFSERYGCDVVVVDEDSPMYFGYPSGNLLLSINFESQIACAKVISWRATCRDLYEDFYY